MLESYCVKIKDDCETRTVTVQVESYDDFVRWFKILTEFEKNKVISYEKDEKGEFNI